MESTLHRQLKARYGPERGGWSEVAVAGARVDAVGPDGELVEIQAGPLSALRRKADALIGAGHRLRIVKPIVRTRRILRADRARGAERVVRLSPRRGAAVEVFDELVSLARAFPKAGLTIEVLGVHIDEVRVPRRRRPGYDVADRRLREADEPLPLREAEDLWALLPAALPGRFTTEDLAAALDRPIDFAQRVAYCLRLSGAARDVGSRRHRRIYQRAGSPEATPPSAGPSHPLIRTRDGAGTVG